MDSIENIKFDVDIDGYGISVATLILEGDFNDECIRYLHDIDAEGLHLRIPRQVAEKLVKEVSAYL